MDETTQPSEAGDSHVVLQLTEDDCYDDAHRSGTSEEYSDFALKAKKMRKRQMLQSLIMEEAVAELDPPKEKRAPRKQVPKVAKFVSSINSSSIPSCCDTD